MRLGKTNGYKDLKIVLLNSRELFVKFWEGVDNNFYLYKNNVSKQNNQELLGSIIRSLRVPEYSRESLKCGHSPYYFMIIWEVIWMEFAYNIMTFERRQL